MPDAQDRAALREALVDLFDAFGIKGAICGVNEKFGEESAAEILRFAARLRRRATPAPAVGAQVVVVHDSSDPEQPDAWELRLNGTWILRDGDEEYVELCAHQLRAALAQEGREEMTDLRAKMQHCAGCRNDFYNGKNDLGVTQCWSLKSAKLVRRKEVPINQRPPWNQEAREFFNCYHRPGYVYVEPNVTR